MSSKKKIVVVGAGIAARTLVKNLRAGDKSGDLHITIVQPNTFSELSWYCTSEITNKRTFEENSTFETVAGAHLTVYGIASACGDETLAVTPLEAGKDVQLVPFDILVCATGFSFPTVLPVPGQTAAERKAEVEQVTRALTSFETRVVMSGGGHIGVELAGDALEERPDHNKGSFTLVCSSKRLLPDRPAEYGQKAVEQLEKMGCKVILNDRVMNKEKTVIAQNTVIELESGKTLECDAYIPTYNGGPATEWITKPLPDGSSALPSGVVNEENEVVVNDFLASKAYPKLFALARTNNRGEANVGMNIQNQAGTVAANILRPESTKHSPGPIKFPIYQLIGHKTYAFVSPDGMPGGTLIFQWCGFPCNLLCPCFLCGVLCGPLTCMCCGWCCMSPEGKGFPDLIEKAAKMKLSESMLGYNGLGKSSPPNNQKMSR